jgi:hypothetical protein
MSASIERGLRFVQTVVSRRFRRMFVNILRQIETSVIPR